MSAESGVPRLSGLRHLAAAPGYSLAGLSRLIRETAFRHELLAFGLSLPLFFVMDAAPVFYLALVMVFLLVAALEALNTAIEEIVDRISPERSEMARNAKDLGSFAVFCGLAAWALLTAFVAATGLGFI